MLATSLVLIIASVFLLYRVVWTLVFVRVMARILVIDLVPIPLMVDSSSRFHPRIQHAL